jgi:hypothetical protein
VAWSFVNEALALGAEEDQFPIMQLFFSPG